MQTKALKDLLREKIKPEDNLKVRVRGEKAAYFVWGVDWHAWKVLVDMPGGPQWVSIEECGLSSVVL